MNGITSFVLGSGLFGIGYVVGWSLGVPGSLGAVSYAIVGGIIGTIVAIGIVALEDWYLCKQMGITSGTGAACAWIRKLFRKHSTQFEEYVRKSVASRR